MKMKNKLIVPLLFAVSTTALADYRVGISSRNISPTAEEASASCMGGYGGPFERCGNTEVHDPITVRSLYLADKDTKSVIISLDTVGVGDDLITNIKTYTSIFLGVSSNNIKVTATHSHSGPDLQGIWGGVDEDYKKRILVNSVISAVIAKFSSSPVSLHISQSEADILNRRGLADVDDTVTAMVFKKTRGNATKAILVNMSAHPTLLSAENNAYSSDYVHHLRETLEREIGGTVIFINGIVGDASPDTSNYPIESGFEAAKLFGEDVAGGIIDQLESSQEVTGDFAIDTTSYTHPITNPGMLALIGMGLLDVNLDEENNIHTQISHITFGDMVSAVTVPGEVLTSIGRAFQDSMDSPYELVFGLTDSSYGYFIPSAEFGSIPGRITEEQASIDIMAGDTLQSTTESFLARE